MKHKKFANIFLPKSALAILLCVVMVTTGCGGLLAVLEAAAAVANVAAPIISSVSPEYGALVAAVGKDLTDLDALYAKYEKAASTEKPGIAGQIHALTSTALANLQTIFVDGRIKNPKLQVEITAFVAVANSAIQAILNRVQAKTPAVHAAVARSMALSSTLPTVKGAKSAGDLKKYWNGEIGATHPDAIVK